jgi:hypothetical protein
VVLLTAPWMVSSRVGKPLPSWKEPPVPSGQQAGQAPRAGVGNVQERPSGNCMQIFTCCSLLASLNDKTSCSRSECG